MRRILLVAAVLAPSTALAHIHLVSPLGRTDSATGDQKAEHCGVAGQGRNPARVTEKLPGETITVTWMETINHPGWFRIAFQPDGEIFGIPPASNGVDGLGGAANFPTANQEGVDAANNSIVLLDRIPDGMLSATITLPNMECSNCTLQFIQVMIDKKPYTVDANSDDIYFNCADITLTNTPSNPPPDGAPPGDDDAGPGGGGGGNVSGGGCSTGGGSAGGAGLLIALAMLGFRRRRR